MPRRMRSSLLGPNPATPRSLPPRTASSSSPTLVMPSSPSDLQRALGADARDLREQQGAGRHLGAQLVDRLDRPGPPVLGDLRGDRRADAGDLGQGGVGNRADVVRVPADRLGGLLVVPRAERVTAGEPEQFRVLPQQRGDFLVDRRHGPIVTRHRQRQPRRAALLAVIHASRA